MPSNPAAAYSTICLTIFVFRGQPDLYNHRHVLLYFTSPENPNFHETVHAQREDEDSLWKVDQIHSRVDWILSATYLSHVNAGAVRVGRGEEMMPVNVVAATPIEGRDADWNCQNFLLEGLQSIVDYGLHTQEWFDSVQDELLDRLLDGSLVI